MSDDELHQVYRYNVQEMIYMKPEPMVKLILSYRAIALRNIKTDFLQIGDCSGMHGVKPLTLEKFLSNKKYLNASLTADVKFGGYLAFGDYQLRQHPEAKYLVFYLSSHGLPSSLDRKIKKGVEEEVEKIYNSRWEIFWRLPSLLYRKKVIDTTYYHNEMEDNYSRESMRRIKEKFDIDPSHDFIDFIAYSKGWIPKLDSGNMMDASVPKENSCMSEFADSIADAKKGSLQLYKNLVKIHDLASKYKVRMILLFAPVSCIDDGGLSPITNEIARFAKEYPDAIIPAPFINHRSASDFVTKYHLSPEAAEENSVMLGKLLSQIINQ